MHAQEKPRLRGVSHQAAFFGALIAGGILTAVAPTPKAMVAAAIYVACMAAMFGFSALYHIPKWEPAQRQLMRRVDHMGIYLAIAGSYTPICLLALEPGLGTLLLKLVWLVAGLGMAREIFWQTAPKPVSASIYALFGCLVVPFLPQVMAALGATKVALIAAGGVFYLVGALAYALQRPNPIPNVFGYHEVFHALVIVASVCQFLALSQVIRPVVPHWQDGHVHSDRVLIGLGMN